MFEFMHKYRLPVLIVIVVGMTGFGIYSTVEGLLASLTGADKLGSFRVPGEADPITLDNAALAEAQQDLGRGGMLRFFIRNGVVPRERLQSNDADSDTLYAYTVLREVAKDVPVDEAQVRRMARQAAGIEEDSDREAPSDLQDSFRRMLQVFTLTNAYSRPPQVASLEKAFESYSASNGELSFSAVMLRRKQAEDFTLDLESEEGMATLRKHFEDNPVLKNTLGDKENYDLSVVVARWYRDDLSLVELEQRWTEMFAPKVSGITVTDEEARARYDASATTADTGVTSVGLFAPLLAKLEEAKAAEGEGEGEGESEGEGEGESEPEAADPYEMLKPWIKRELALKKALETVAAAAASPEISLAEAAEASGFELRSLKGQTDEDLRTQDDFGSVRLSGFLRTGAIATLGAEGGYELGTVVKTPGAEGQPVFDETGKFVALFALDARTPFAPATFEKVTGKVYENWQERQIQPDFQDRQDAFRDAMKEWSDAQPAMAEPLAAFEAGIEEAVQKEITDRALTLDPEKEEDQAQLESIREQVRGKLELEHLAEPRKELAAAAFQAAADKLNLKVHQVGPVGQSLLTVNAFNLTDVPEAEATARFLRSSSIGTAVRNVEAGQVSPNPARTMDIVAFVRVDEKTEPTPKDMLADAAGLSQVLGSALPFTAPSAPFSLDRLRSEGWPIRLEAKSLEEAEAERIKRQQQAAERSSRRSTRDAERAAELQEELRRRQASGESAPPR